MRIFRSIFFSSILFFSILSVQAQIKGKPEKPYNPDTVFVFQSPHDLITKNQGPGAFNNAAGVDLLLSNSGFGVGGFYSRLFSEDYYGFISLYISGARITDENEYYYPDFGDYLVPEKINRIFKFPLMFGVQKFFEIDKSFRPFISVGIGPTLILHTPYKDSNGNKIEFFSSFSESKASIKFGGFIGIGTNFGSSPKSLNGIYLRYYFIPYGANGLESVQNKPIKDFGGLFLCLSIGGKF